MARVTFGDSQFVARASPPTLTSNVIAAIVRVTLIPRRVCRTPGISCEAVPAPDGRERAQGGTSACRTGAALSFVSFIPLLGGIRA
jgi:hypothetical protein